MTELSAEVYVIFVISLKFSKLLQGRSLLNLDSILDVLANDIEAIYFSGNFIFVLSQWEFCFKELLLLLVQRFHNFAK